MSRRVVSVIALVAGGGLGLVLLLVLVGLAFGGNVRDDIAKDYQRVGDRDGAQVYRSRRSVPDTAEAITDADRPSQRLTDSAGVFLRYPDTIVAVHRAASGSGTEIEVDDDDRGYARWYPYVGSYFGSGRGVGESFRGGGPGGGK